jgi:hypothetical protein
MNSEFLHVEDCFQTIIVSPKVLNKQSRIVDKEVVMGLDAEAGLAFLSLEYNVSTRQIPTLSSSREFGI